MFPTMLSPSNVVFVVLAVLFCREGLCCKPVPVCHTEGCHKTSERLKKYMDTTVKPCDDFYRFACGNFLKSTKLRDDQPSKSSFTDVEDKLEEQLKQIVLEKYCPSDPWPLRNVKHLFALCLDQKTIDARGVGPAVTLLRTAGGWPVLGGWNNDNWNFLDTEIHLRKLSMRGGSLFNIGVKSDIINNSRLVITLEPPTMKLLTKEFLVKGKDDPVVKAYYNYMVDIAVMYGADRNTATQQLWKSLLLEIELAKIMSTEEEQMELSRMYNSYSPQQLTDELGWINWAKLLDNVLPKSVLTLNNCTIHVSDVYYFKKIWNVLSNVPDEVIANYMMWYAAEELSSYLTTEMGNRQFQLLNTVIGTLTPQPRWKECLQIVEKRGLSLALSSLYVKKLFDETSKKDALELTERIRQEMSRRVSEAVWMDDHTKKKAEFKASQMVEYIGYPDELNDNRHLVDFYEGLNIEKEHYLEAILELNRWSTDYSFRQLPKPVNKTDWRSHGPVTHTNALYRFTENSIQVPAGILQQPFFNSKVPKYVNYATIGVIVGHEMTHGFDDQGSQFDFSGNLNYWWDEEGNRNFTEKKQCMIYQYGNYTDKQTGLNLNGVTTLSENVADNGGLRLSYHAYRRFANYLPEPEPLLPGLERYTQDQLFLLSMANMWCTSYQTERLKSLITSDDHSPAEFRVNGVLKNLPEFSDIFKCSTDVSMNPKDKCAVW